MKIALPVFLSRPNPKSEINISPINSLAPKVLTDVKDIQQAKPYLDSLKETINQAGITNIAITGGYGSGKSTIIKTFQNLNPQHEYLNISLASFNDIANDEEISNSKNEEGLKKSKEEVSNKSKKENLERLLEVSILQQIFYHVKPSEIPDSRFKRIINITDEKIFSIALGLIFWVLSGLILFKFNYINKLNPNSWKADYSLHSIDFFAILLFLIFFIGIGLFAKTIVRLFTNSKINKFNIKGELELADNLDKSVFNQHLEEILYFFERTKFNVVVIEDLDRFDNTDIFTKLREINILLNNSKLIEREINFIYAIKDEMFTNKSERVKFFEYIIPVIPFINPSTAGDQLTKLIEDAGLKGVLSKDFTEDVVTFIDDIDMRLLINIFHEYQIYKRNLINDLDQDCLFAMITYKNLYPDDFGDLQKRKGNLYAFLTKKGEYIKNLIQKINLKINDIEKQIGEIMTESISDVEELRAIYINAIHSRLPNAVALNFESKLLFSELSKDENFEKLLENKNISYTHFTKWSNPYYTEQTTDSGFKFSEIEKKVNPKFSYSEREKHILEKKDDSLEMLKKDIEKFKNNKSEIESWSLKQIFEEIDINPFLDGFSENELIRNLLLNGYINENYNDYISLFHEVNLTKDDYTFERKVKSGVHSPFDYNLSKIDNLVKKIPEKYFSRESILNFEMLDFLAENYEHYYQYYDSILNVLSNEKDRSIEFIKSYIERDKNIETFIVVICKSWLGFWDYTLLKSNLEKEKIKHYLEIIVKYADIEDISKFMNGSDISNHIKQQADFLSLCETPQYNEKVTQVIEALNVKFKSLEHPNDKTQELFDYVYSNNYYEINIENIELMLTINDTISLEDLKKSNYTILLDSEHEELIEYINNNINDYVKNVLLKIPENVSESESVIIDLLNNENLKADLKLEIIYKQSEVIQDLSLIYDIEIKQELLNNNKTLAKWENVFDYYDSLETEEFDETIITFLSDEHNFNPLSKIKLKVNDKVSTFSTKLIECNELNDESYAELIESLPYIWSNANIENVDYEKAESLILHNKLSLSRENFDKLKTYFSDLHVNLVEKHPSEFLSNFADYVLNEKDILLLLNSSITTKNKIKLIEKIDDNTIIQNQGIGSKVCSILANSTYKPISYSLLESLIKHSASYDERIKLINKHFYTLTDIQIQSLVEQLGYQEVFQKKHRPKFYNTSYNAELFKNLDNRGMIIRYEVYAKDKNFLRVFANH